jgi:thiosulfate dehydrogenase
MKLLQSNWFPILLGAVIVVVMLNEIIFSENPAPVAFVHDNANSGWVAPDIAQLPDNDSGRQVRYGRELIANTALYLGPRGTIAAITNGMNCQDCHLEAGAKSFAGAFSAVASTYPRYRDRSGRVESIEFRVNDCLLRSLNGEKIDSNGREMRAMVAYLKWIGSEVSKNVKPVGSGLEELSFLTRAADPEKGHQVFAGKCTSCHGEGGQGLANHDSSFYLYPPLWGPHSFNVSAGLYRITRLAGFIRDNMPAGAASHETPQLSDEEAWDVAAFVLSKPRPEKFFADDWPKLDTKAIDYPFGPYADNFSEKQHKFGPFGPIQQARTRK